jgi:hypothetical protein
MLTLVTYNTAHYPAYICTTIYDLHYDPRLLHLVYIISAQFHFDFKWL